MRAIIAISVLFFAFPAPFFAFPIPKGANAGGANIAGTTWAGNIDKDLVRVTFKADGTLWHAGGTSAGGTWKQDGDRVTWQVNNYSTYEAVLQGDAMDVKARNDNGWKREFQLRKQAE